ncbi:MAG: OHCU decarboxylase [Acidiferrobacteraceae bacterium]|nr:OHCU decarboxylase [Acidiferrobacteraceae bacterium]
MDSNQLPVITPNQMNRENFVSTFGHIYENSPWIATHVWNMGLTQQHNTLSGLFTAFVDVIASAGMEPQMRLLCTHPQLARRIGQSETLTKTSRDEQETAGLNNCSEEEFNEFRSLNHLYKERFGFPFILAVGGRHRNEILEIFRKRIKNDSECELKEALKQVHQIAYLRLCDIKLVGKY